MNKHNSNTSSNFKTANTIKKTELVDDPGARQFLKDISIDINSTNPSLIKAEIAKRQLDKDSGITKKEANRAIEELKRNGVPK